MYAGDVHAQQEAHAQPRKQTGWCLLPSVLQWEMAGACHSHSSWNVFQARCEAQKGGSGVRLLFDVLHDSSTKVWVGPQDWIGVGGMKTSITFT